MPKVRPRSGGQHCRTRLGASHRPRRHHTQDNDRRRGWRRWAGKAALAAGGLLVGGVLVGTLTANAATSSTGTAAAGSASTQQFQPPFPAHGTPAHENLEKPVTGAAADKTRGPVKAVAVARPVR